MAMKVLDDTENAFEILNGIKYFKMKNGDYFRRVPHKGKMRRQYFLKLRCSVCNEIVFRYRSNYRKKEAANRITICDNVECVTQARSGENNPLWAGGRKYKRGRNKGHVLVFQPDHPFARKGYVPEHRVVIENEIGRHLTEDEVVHHIDCVQDNNEPSNLVLCENHSQHFISHATLNSCVAELLEKGYLGFDRESLSYYVK